MGRFDSAAASSSSADEFDESAAEPVRTVVVAHGDNDQRAAICDCLTKHGHKVIATSNGREALGHLLFQKVDLIIAAVAMDEMDGLELLRFVPMKTPAVPVIILGNRTSEFDTICLRAASLLGAAKTCVLPLPSAEFLQTVNELLAGH